MNKRTKIEKKHWKFVDDLTLAEALARPQENTLKL